MKDPIKLGQDHLKKILVWTLLMKRGHSLSDFFDYLMTTYWFRAVVDLYFEGRYQEKFNELMEELLRRNTVIVKDGYYHTTVKP
jgi:hypothetical protein